MQGENLRKGPWFEEEDELLTAIVSLMGDKRWDSLAKFSGLRRSGKSCRLRWMNYLRPNLKHGRLSEEEKRTIIELHKQWGNKWSRIALGLPGRTDNEIKNYWRSHSRKKAKVQEEGRCTDISKDIKTDSLLVPSNSSDYKPGKEESFGTNNEDSFDTFDPKNYDMANSPYETRLSDWILSSWSEEQSEGSYCGEYNTNLNTGFSYSGWDSEEVDISLWGSCPSGGHC